MRKIATTSELQSELTTLLSYASSHKPSRAVLASRLRKLSRRVLADAFDRSVTNPLLLPKALTKAYVQGLKKALKGSKAQVTECRTTMPRGWDYGNLTRLTLTTPGGEAVELTLTLNVAADKASQSGEASGNASFGSNSSSFGEHIATARDSAPLTVVNRLIQEVADRFRNL